MALKKYGWTFVLKVLSLGVYMLIVFLGKSAFDSCRNFAEKDVPGGAETIISPRSLTIRDIKTLLKRRGASCIGCLEKRDFEDLLEKTGPIYQDELENSPLLLPISPTWNYFEEKSHFIESIKYGAWFIQITNVDETPEGKQLLNDEIWNSVVHRMAQHGIRTGIFNCSRNIDFCFQKGWDTPRMILTRFNGKNIVTLPITKETDKQGIMEMLEENVVNYIHKIKQIFQLEKMLKSNVRKQNEVVLVTHWVAAPLTFKILSHTLSFKFNQFTIRKNEQSKIERLQKFKITVPSLVIFGQEKIVVLQEKDYKRMDLDSLRSYILMSEKPWDEFETKSWKILNILIVLHMFQMSVHVWKKNQSFVIFLGWSLGLLFITNFFFITVSSTVNFLLRFSWSSVVLKSLGTFLFFSHDLSYYGHLILRDFFLLQSYPVVFYTTLFIFGVISSPLVIWLDEVVSSDNYRTRSHEREQLPMRAHSTNQTLQRPTSSVRRISNDHSGFSRLEMPYFALSEDFDEPPEFPPEHMQALINSFYDSQFPQFQELLRNANSRPPPPSSCDYINGFPTWTFGRNGNENDHMAQPDEDAKGDTLKCVVCLEHYEIDQLCCRLPCDHEFHKKCITDWLPWKQICPLCRRSANPN